MSGKIILVSLGVVGLFLPAWACAGEAPPAIVVRVKSIDAIVDNFKLLASIAGRKDAAAQIEGLIKTQVGDKGLAGIDMTKPLGAYARLGEKPDDVTGALLIPIADEKAFLAMLKGLYKVDKEADGLYVLKTKTPFDGYVRFAKGYAYVTAFNKAALDDNNMVDPGQLLGGKGTSTVSALVRLDLLPKQAKQLALAQIEQELQKAQEIEQPGATATQKAFRIACLQEITKGIDLALKDGKDLALNLELTKEVFNLRVTLNGKDQSNLAKALAKIGQQPSLFAGLKAEKAVFTGAMNLVLPEEVHHAWNKVVDEAIEQAKKSLLDPAKKKQAEGLLQALAPSLKAGAIDTFASVVAGKEKGQFNVLAAVKIKDGVALGNTIHDLIAEALKELPAASKDQIKLKFDTVDGLAIHRFELPADPFQGKTPTELFGEPYLYMVFRGDALLVGLGKDGLAMLKNAATAKGGAAPLLVYDFDLARFADLLPVPLPEQDRKLFKQEDEGRFRITIVGGSSLTVTVETRPAALQFLLLMSQKKSE